MISGEIHLLLLFFSTKTVWAFNLAAFLFRMYIIIRDIIKAVIFPVF